MDVLFALKHLQKEVLASLELGEASCSTVELDQNKVGRLSRMDAMQQQAMNLASQQVLRQRLIDINKAIEAVNEGDYGFCHECGNTISAERLSIKPETLWCVSCMQKSEC